jgi:hypothetical protein
MAYVARQQYTFTAGGRHKSPADTMLSLLAGEKPTSLCTTTLAGANYSRKHVNFYVPV